MEDAERKIQVLKAAVVKLTRQKAESDEKYSHALEELESERRRSAQLADDLAHVRVEAARHAAAATAAAAAAAATTTASRWAFFRGGSGGGKDHDASAAAAGAAAGSHATAESTVLSDLILQNEKLHEDLFDTRTSLEKKLKEADRKIAELEGALRDANSRLAAVTVPGGATFAEQTPSAGREAFSEPNASIDLASAVGAELVGSTTRCVRLIDVEGQLQSAALAAKLLLPSLISALKAGGTITTPSSTIAAEDAVRVQDLSVATQRIVERVTKLWTGRGRIDGAVDEMAWSAKRLCLLIGDHSMLLCRVILAVASRPGLSDAECRNAGRALQRFCNLLGTSIERSISQDFVIEIDVDAAVKWKIVNNFVRAALPPISESAPRVHTALAELCAAIDQMLSAVSPPVVFASFDIADRVSEIVNAVVHRRPYIAPLPPKVADAPQPPGGASIAEAAAVANVDQHAVVVSSQPNTERWLRLADDQAVFWRRQFEIAMTELEEKTALFDQRVEEVAALQAAVVREQRDKEWTNRALQAQIEVLSEQLATLASGTA